MPLVSVIMNIRNGADFLREALDSVIIQSFTDWEIVVWDDLSTDGSAGIVGDFQDERVRYFLSSQHTTLSKARDQAIRRASGEWLAFLDQDDVWLPQKLEKQMALAEPEIGIIYGRAVLFDSDRGDLRQYDYFHEFGLLPEGDIFHELFRSACFIPMSSAVLRRSAVLEIGKIPDGIQIAPDYYLYTAIARQYRARAVQDVVCRYRVHARNMSQSRQYRLRRFQEPLAIVEHWTPYLDDSVASYRRSAYATCLALEEMRQLATVCRGVRRLILDGSITWLISRPIVRGWRLLKRRIRKNRILSDK